jgi:hypothetical protein
MESTNYEKSQLSKPAMLAVEKIRCRKDYPSRFLQDQIGEAIAGLKEQPSAVVASTIKR